jgi:hypothetical protein
MSELFIQLELNKRRLLHGRIENPLTMREDKEEADPADPPADPEPEAQKSDYLDAVNQMHFEFSLCQETQDVTKVFTVRICAYDLRHYGEHRFVLHLMQYDGQIFDYPKFSFQCAAATDDTEVYFKNQCWTHLSEVLETVDDTVKYRGFIKDDKSDELYVFFDATGQKKMDGSLPRVWASMDEIMNQHRINGFPVQRFPLFLQNTHVIFVDNYVPEILYLCKEEDGYVNLFQDQNLLDERISHPVLGDYFIFSKAPLAPTTADKPIRRFLGFCEDGLYLTSPLQGAHTSLATRIVNYFVPTGSVSGSDLLSGAADLSGSDLSSAADLSGSDLSGSDLSGSDLSGSDLSKSMFSKIGKFFSQNVFNSDLSGTDLSGTDLSGNNFFSTLRNLFDGSKEEKEPVVPVEEKGPVEEEKESVEEKGPVEEKEPVVPKGPVEEEKESVVPIEEEKETVEDILLTDAPCIYFQEFNNEDRRIAFWCIKSEDDYVEI